MELLPTGGKNILFIVKIAQDLKNIEDRSRFLHAVFITIRAPYKSTNDP